MLEHLVAGEPRHHDVQQHEVERLLRHAIERLMPVLGDHHGMPVAPQPARQQVAIQLVVVDDEDRVAGGLVAERAAPVAHRACASPVLLAGTPVAGMPSSCRR